MERQQQCQFAPRGTVPHQRRDIRQVASEEGRAKRISRAVSARNRGPGEKGATVSLSAPGEPGDGLLGGSVPGTSRPVAARGTVELAADVQGVDLGAMASLSIGG